MIYRFIGSVLLAFMLVTACNGSSDNLFIAGDNVLVLESPAIRKAIDPIDTYDTESMIGTTGILAVADRYAIVGITSPTHRFRIIDLSDCSIVTDFSNKGNGPDEDTGMIFSQCRKVDGHNLFDIYTLNKHSLLTVDLDSLIDNGLSKVIERVPTPRNAMKAYRVGDKVLSQTYFDEDYIAFKLHPATETSPIRTFRLFGDESVLNTHYFFFSSHNAMKPDGSKAVMFMHDFDKINILDLQGDDHVTITTGHPKSDQNTISNLLSDPEARKNTFYYYGAVTDSRIYALRIGAMIDRPFNVTIQVFDWDFNYIAEYLIDEPITTFAVDEDNSLLYGMTNEVMYSYRID